MQRCHRSVVHARSGRHLALRWLRRRWRHERRWRRWRQQRQRHRDPADDRARAGRAAPRVVRPGPDLLRPAGGKGTAKATSLHTTINGFWVEYPGSGNASWIAPETGQTWKFCGGSDDPYELTSPLQTQYNGCVASEWFDPPTSYPTALMPITFTLPSAGYELSMEGYPAPIAGAYVAIGFTSSGAVTSNLTTSGALWLRVTDPTRFGFPLHYELRAGSLASGRVIASGDAGASGWNRMAIRYAPAAGTVTLTNDGVVIGTYAFTMPTPKYLAFEGVGILDDLVLRQ
ncbi:hypothetical protein J421_2263 [Gemmatirosa kalamazoonensis]|uniref:Uncharacterized protein n=1 Tax=Gemmatirosa kalamazoonensis TaxID=861299 RepID=W0RHK1_9BACT|nr:hypothetical protein [Gemmatirosa kalamazoonensis]AHG89800.1 hypothetical protein J421_2263 [Gemmatirosa kalamazoonensis]